MKLTNLIVKHCETGERLASIEAKMKEKRLKSKRPYKDDLLVPFYDALNKKYAAEMTQEWVKYSDKPLEVDGFNFKATFWGKK